MLPKDIKFTDYEGKERTERCYFDLSPKECIDMNMKYEREGGVIGRLKTLMSEKINGELPKKPVYDFISEVVEEAYGIRPKDDPTLFLKEDECGRPVKIKFRQSLAYKTFVWDLVTGKESLEDFVTQVFPNTADESAKAEAEKDPTYQEFQKLITEG